MAEATLTLMGLDKPRSEVLDSNGLLVALDRVGQRMETWGIAEESSRSLAQNPSLELRQTVAKLAISSGYFSIWMTVFELDPIMRRMFIDSFPGTAKNCFDPISTQPITPRPGNGLANGSKV